MVSLEENIEVLKTLVSRLNIEIQRYEKIKNLNSIKVKKPYIGVEANLPITLAEKNTFKDKLGDDLVIVKKQLKKVSDGINVLENKVHSTGIIT